METLGAIAILILFFIGAFKYMEYSDGENRTVKAKVFHLLKNSEKFCTIIEKENLPYNQAITDKYGIYGKRLRQIIKEIENDTEEQKEINKSVEYFRKSEITTQELIRKWNFYAYDNLDIIRQLKKLQKRIQEDELKKVLKNKVPNDEVPSKIKELLENNILRFDAKSKSYHLYILDIYHPYELDQYGKPRKIPI